MGRRPLINNQTSEKMRSYLMAGVSLKDACTLLGIGYTTWNDYERKNPDIRRKRKQWQGMLKAQAKLNLAEHIYGNEKKKIKPSVGWSQYYLDSLVDQEYKNAQNAVSRATARKINAEVKRIEAETKRLENGDEGLTKIVFTDDLKPDKEDDTKQEGDENDGTDTQSE